MLQRPPSEYSTPAAVPLTGPDTALPWILRLRYAMAAAQLVTSFGVRYFLNIDLPAGWIAIAPALVVVSNFWLEHRKVSVAESTLIGWLFVLDTICLTVVLMLSGGVYNPFSLLYLVQITLSAAILTPRQTWGLGALSTFCFGLLFLWYRPIEALEATHHGGGSSLHLTGMWIGFVVTAVLIAIFSGKISKLLRAREASLLRMQEELARTDRLASLATLAAGAAHELNTPLATIAVAAKELERYATQKVQDSAVAEDSRLIRTEVDRCREILRRLSSDWAEPAGEEIEPVATRSLADAVASAFQPALEIEMARDADVALRIPRHAVEQALMALVRNAIDASPAESAVRLSIARRERSVVFNVTDSGCGMSSETLRRAGEPFFTTKEPGRGMGLGIFLVRTLADRLGGQLLLESKLGRGTEARLELPIATFSGGMTA
jgi:two-component system, sensor histidine kinase RegB